MHDKTEMYTAEEQQKNATNLGNHKLNSIKYFSKVPPLRLL